MLAGDPGLRRGFLAKLPQRADQKTPVEARLFCPFLKRIEKGQNAVFLIWIVPISPLGYPVRQFTVPPTQRFGLAVIVVGNVTGNIHASERVEIQATGVVQGDIKTPRLLIQEGATLNGAIDMSGAKPGQLGKPVQAEGGTEAVRKTA